MQGYLTVSCPYCNHKTDVPCPNEYGSTTDIECTPYTRDIGRFDPKEEKNFLDLKGWSRIGKDFLPFLNYENFGILRTVEAGMNIQYRVQGCLGCKQLYDVYANYSNKPLKELWKHLFERDTEGNIKKYEGKSILLNLVKHLEGLFSSKVTSIFILSILLLILSLLPIFFAPSEILKDDEIKLILAYSIFCKSFLTIGIGVLIFYVDKYVKFFDELKDFDELFLGIDKNGFSHWRNFTFCRLVGVQFENQNSKPNQIDIIVTFSACLGLFIAWTSSKLSFGYSISLLFYLVFSIGCWVLYRYLRTKYNILVLFKVRLISLIIYFFISYFIWYFTYLRHILAIQRWDIINSCFDILYWLISVYIIGIATWLALNTSIYIITGLTKIPLNLTAFNNYATIKPIRKIQSFSNTFILIVFVLLTINFIVLNIVENLHPNNNILYYSNPNWVSFFLVLVVGGVLIALGFGAKKSMFFYFTLLYGVILFFTNNQDFIFYGFEVNSHILITSVFFSFLLTYHFYTTENLIKEMLDKKKKEAIKELNREIDFNRTFLQSLKPSNIETSILIEQKNKALDNLVKLFSITN